MDYSPLRISTLKPGRSIDFDLYIFYKETFLRYKESGYSLEEALFAKLRQQKVAKFYITASDEPHYQKYLDDLLMETMDSPDVPVEEKVDLAEGTASTAVDKLQTDPESVAAYKMTEKAANTLQKVISGNPDAIKIIFGRKAETEDKVIKHSLNVCALSPRVAEKCGLKGKDIENLATAALVQYIGINYIEGALDLFLKPKSELTSEELLTYSGHAAKSVELMDGKSYVNSEILELIKNHEETLQGTGPNKKMKLSKSEEILSLVNKYDHRVTVCELTPKAAFKEVQIDELGNYGLDLIDILKKVLNEEGIMGLE